MMIMMMNQKPKTAIILRDEDAAIPSIEAHVYWFPRSEYPDSALLKECSDLKEHYENVIIIY